MTAENGDSYDLQSYRGKTMAQINVKRWGWAAAVAAAILVVGLGILAEINKKTPVRTAVAKTGTIQFYIEERGRTSLPHIYHVTMPMQGRVLPIKVEEGDAVKTGDIVVRLEDLDWQDATKETVDILVAVSNWVQAAEAQVKAAKIHQDFTKWEWETDEKLLQSKTISEKQGRESRRRFLDSSVKIEESQSMLHMSKALQSIMDLLPGYVERNLDRTLVRSPVTGTVLKRHVWNEKVMTPGEPLLDIGDLQEIEITSDILTEAAVHIQAGDRVEIFGEAVGDTVVEGSVRLVEPKAFTKISSLGVEEQRVTVKISFIKGTLESFANSGRSIGLQYRVRVRIITDVKEKVVVIPRTALFHGMNGQWQVYTVEDGRAHLIDVRVGLLNDFEAEIKTGLKAGDAVIVAPESSISNGIQVTAIGQGN